MDREKEDATMGTMREIKAYIRPERLSRLLDALRCTGACRFYVSHVHALGAGVDPDRLRPSFEEEGTYMEKVKLELLCEAERVHEVVETIREHAATGHRGDGVVVVTPVETVVSLRTGDRDALALL